ncbi:MAG: hypothetical protein JJ964_12000, partial [Rhizobiales bacterium]|nr:hypothetical protein [Hyphomicrobiales bacterium]
MQWKRFIMVICLLLGGGLLLSACSAEDLGSIPKKTEKEMAPGNSDDIAAIEAPSKL